ncbi:uncharacterized protein [Argopecten irradians]|uniref:uncharacterized protein n=1 Tax=Argopecten irradians TaxID=31199 RepID=UPI003719D409
MLQPDRIAARERALDLIRQATKEGRLFDAEELFRELFLTNHLSLQEMGEIVKGQVAIARRTGKRGWLRRASQAAGTLFSDQWIRDNISPNRVPANRKSSRQSTASSRDPLAPVRDYRLALDPTLPTLVTEDVRGTGNQPSAALGAPSPTETVNMGPEPMTVPGPSQDDPSAESLLDPLMLLREDPEDPDCLDLEAPSCFEVAGGPLIRLEAEVDLGSYLPADVEMVSPPRSPTSRRPTSQESEPPSVGTPPRKQVAPKRSSFKASPIRAPKSGSPQVSPKRSWKVSRRPTSRHRSPVKKSRRDLDSEQGDWSRVTIPQTITIRRTQSRGERPRSPAPRRRSKGSPDRRHQAPRADRHRSKETPSVTRGTTKPNPMDASATRERKPRDDLLPSDSKGSQKRSRSPEEPETPKLGYSGGRRIKKCAIRDCGMVTSFPKLHLVEVHVPAIFREGDSHDRDLANTRRNCLELMAKSILGPKATLQDLVQHINRYRLMAQGWQITPGQSDLMEEMCRVMGWPIPNTFSLDPMNSPAGLLHWRSLTILASAIPDSTMAELRETFALTIPQPVVPAPMPGDVSAPYEVLVVEGEEVQGLDEPEVVCFPPAFDAHFHLDRTRKRLGLRDTASVHDVEVASPPVEERRRVRMTGGVAVYCDPSTYPSDEEIRQVTGDGYHVAVGAHPKALLTSEEETAFLDRVRRPDVKGFGEIGLDLSVPSPDHWVQQDRQLRRLLQQILPHQVLVLHIRSLRDDPTALFAYNYALRLVASELLGKKDQRIQLHCFGGSQDVVHSWLEAFPNTYFSVSGMVHHFQPAQQRALRAIPRDRLILETDAPYFPAPGFPHGAPHLLGYTAQHVAEILGDLDMTAVLEVTDENAFRLFH